MPNESDSSEAPTAEVEANDDDRRWAEAEALAQGIDDPGRLRRRRNRAFLLIAGIIVASWVLGIAFGLVALALPHDAAFSGVAGDGPDDVLDGRLIAALVIEGIGFVTMVVGFVWAWRTGRYILRWRSIASPLTRRQRKRAQRAIAGKSALVPDRKHYLLALADQNRRTTEGVTPLYGGIVLLDSVQLLLNPTPYSLVLTLIVAAAFAVAAVQLTLVYRRSGRYIAAHDEGAPPAA